MTNFNSRIKEFRKSKKLTQKRTAELLNITERAYQYYEAGTREPNLETLLNIAETFNVSLDYLVGRTDNPNVNK